MSWTLQPGPVISRSGNIALYPALCSAADGSAACAWYEYTSPDRPTRSDLWFSKQLADGSWGEACNVSGGISYNNGPSLAYAADRGFIAAWHSWRPPGREPFFLDGDKYNIWLSRSSDGLSWTDPELPFPGLSQTKYSALAIAGQSVHLAFSQQTAKTILTSSSRNLKEWETPRSLSESASRFPSMCSQPDGKLLLAFSRPDDNGLWISKSVNGMDWQDPRQILADSGRRLTKPKISADSSGAVWIACQTENWGSFTRRFRIRNSGDVLKISLGTSGGAGNAVWTLNAVNISRPCGEILKTIRFGPRIAEDAPGVVRIGSEDWAWNANHQCGFDGPVEEILRELGSEVTRSMVYCSRPRILEIGTGRGEYEVELIFSSWVAARPALQVSFHAEAWEIDSPTPAGDQCFLFRSKGNSDFELFAETSPQEDHSRPSAVCKTTPGRALVAWTSFEGSAVQIVSQTLANL